MEALGVDSHVERDRVLRDARHTEVVADAADADDERVVAQRAARQDFLAVDRLHRVERDLAARAVEPGQRALRKPESVPVRDRRVVEVVRVGVHAPGRHFMQQRLPDVGGIAVDQRHPHRALATVAVTEPGRQRQAAGTTADDHDSMRIRRAHARRPSACHRASSAHDAAAGIETDRISKVGRPLDVPQHEVGHLADLERADVSLQSERTCRDSPWCRPALPAASGGTACRPCSSPAAATSSATCPDCSRSQPPSSRPPRAAHRSVARASRAGQ